jgi:mRNA-degrading endonuclease toxin of MazEF toxin-antitoxin module
MAFAPEMYNRVTSGWSILTQVLAVVSSEVQTSPDTGNTSYIALGSLLTVVPISRYVATLLDVLIARTNRNRLQFDSVLKTRQISSFDKQRFSRRSAFANRC